MIEFVSVSNSVLSRRWEINSFVRLYVLYTGTEE
jgi:hypothetical protein